MVSLRRSVSKPVAPDSLPFHPVPALRRFLLRAVIAIGSALVAARGQTAKVPDAAAPPDRIDVAALIASLPAWSTTDSVHVGFGYKDNLLLSHTAEESSGFVRGGFDTLLMHARLDQPAEYSFGVNAEGTRYFSGTTVDHEAQAIAAAEWRYHLGNGFTLTLDGRGYYLDQIFDVSDTDVQRVVAQLQVLGAIVGPTLRWSFLRSWWVEVQGNGKRDTYRDGLNNSRVGEGIARLGWRPGARFEASVATSDRVRNYDQRSQYSVSGRPLTGTELKIQQRETEARIEVTWDAQSRWKTTTRGGQLNYRDDGSGYFNYHQRKIEQDLDWVAGVWTVHVEGVAKRLDFNVQTVGLGLNPPPRIKDEFTAQARMDRKVSAHWTVYAEFNWDRNRCNDPIESYNMNEGLLGARWNWDK